MTESELFDFILFDCVQSVESPDGIMLDVYDMPMSQASAIVRTVASGLGPNGRRR